MKTIRMTTFRKGLMLISMPLFFQLIFILFLMKVQSDAAAAERMESHSKDVLLTMAHVQSHLSLAQSASRGYVITANPIFMDQYQAASRDANEALDTLTGLVRDNPTQARRGEELAATAKKLIEWLNQQGERVAAGDSAGAQELVRRLVGRELIEAVNREEREFVQEERRLEQERRDALERERRSQGWALLFGGIAAAVVTGVAAWIFAKGISSRLAVVTLNAIRIAENKELAPAVGGDDEIAALDDTLHATADRLREAATAEMRHKQELQARAAELAHVNESLRQQTQENETFVYSVSHDLRSPMVNLQGFSRELVHASEGLEKLLRDERVPADVRAEAQAIMDGDVRESVRYIQSAVSRSSAIIDALLRLSRAGRVEYRMQNVDLNPVLKRICEALSGTIEGRGATVVVNPLPAVWADATAVEQIFANLVGNAVNYLSPERPGRIEIGAVEEGALDQPGMRVYYVRDNGLGIPAAHLPKVFAAFQRLHGNVAVGEGIGLALVRRAVERHGGRIWVESTVNVGSTFFVAFPEKPADASPK